MCTPVMVWRLGVDFLPLPPRRLFPTSPTSTSLNFPNRLRFIVKKGGFRNKMF